MANRVVNPWEWSTVFGFSQAVEVADAKRWLVCSGQTAINGDGSIAQGDMGAQVRTAFENLVTVLEDAGMTTGDIVRINYYTPDVDGLIGVLGPLREEFLGSNLPASTLLGVTRLAFAELLIEIEATAAR
jgi:enamine deaminase RidA (YjgF/YER057c/UK114 family)